MPRGGARGGSIVEESRTLCCHSSSSIGDGVIRARVTPAWPCEACRGSPGSPEYVLRSDVLREQHSSASQPPFAASELRLDR